MGFPANTDALSVALREAQELAARMKDQAAEDISAMQAGDVSANLVIAVYQRSINAKIKFNEIKNVPGLVDYAKDQFSDVGLNIGTEFNAMIAALDGVINQIIVDFPVDVSGFILKEQLTTTGVDVRSFTSTNTVDLRVKLVTLIGTID